MEKKISSRPELGKPYTGKPVCNNGDLSKKVMMVIDELLKNSNALDNLDDAWEECCDKIHYYILGELADRKLISLFDQYVPDEFFDKLNSLYDICGAENTSASMSRVLKKLLFEAGNLSLDPRIEE